jgi:hypothetical protein
MINKAKYAKRGDYTCCFRPMDSESGRGQARLKVTAE